jgi:hypothetical protein
MNCTTILLLHCSSSLWRVALALCSPMGRLGLAKHSPSAAWRGRSPRTCSGEKSSVTTMSSSQYSSLARRSIQPLVRAGVYCIFHGPFCTSLTHTPTPTDLLGNRKPVSVLEDSFGETRVVGATEARVLCKEDFYKLIETAAEFRKTSRTDKNEFSSRSHAVCRIVIANSLDPSVPEGLLYLVDLAGSEAARDMANHSTERMKETRSINTSLSTLKDCIRGRVELGINGNKKRPYIPFRQSVLTKTLKHLFDPVVGRTCKMSVIACVNPSFLDVGPSKNTFRFAEMLRVPVPMSTALVYNPMAPSTWSNTELKTWILEKVSPVTTVLGNQPCLLISVVPPKK